MSVNNTPLPHVQHSNSLPVANNVNIQYQQQPGLGGANYGYRHSQSMGAMPMLQQQQQLRQLQQVSYQQPSGGPNGAANGTIMDTMVQGFVDAAAQQVGQTFAQSIMNPDGSNNSDPNGGGDNSSNPSIISIGSSILSGVFGGDSDNSQNQEV
jgi:hypothetical protein